MKIKRSYIEQIRDLLFVLENEKGLNKTKILTKGNFCSMTFEKLLYKLMARDFIFQQRDKFFITEIGRENLRRLNILINEVNTYV